MNHQKEKVRKLTTMAIMSALSVVLVALIHIPFIPPVSFLEYDPADIPVLICGFAFGPAAGLIVALVASVIQGVTVSAQSGIYGIIMHFLSTGIYVLVSSLIYKHNKTKKTAVISLAFGALAMILMMFGANLVVTPAFMGLPVNAMWSYMPLILLFNLMKSVINGLVTFLIYKKVKHLFLEKKK